MNTLTIILVVLALLGVAAFFLRRIYLRRLENITLASKASAQNIQSEIFDLLKPIYRSLSNQETPSSEEISRLAQDPRTRFKLYEMLLTYNAEALFPKDQLTHQSLAESQFIYRMQHAHRLGTVPDEIEFDKKITIKRGEKYFTYYTFRFNMNPPHSLASKGWHRAICGPYENHHPMHTLAMNIHFTKLDDWENALAHVENAHDSLYQEPSHDVKKLLNLT